MKGRTRRWLIGALLLFSMLLSGCEEAEAEIFLDLALDWGHEKGLLECENAGDDPASCVAVPTTAFYQWVAGEGAESFAEDTMFEGLGDLAGDLIKPDLDESATDVLDTARTAKDIVDADALADEGFAEGDPEKIKQAIDMREGDWSYDQMLSVIYLVNGDTQAASDAQLQAEEKAAEYLAATLAAEELSQGDEKAHAACVAAYDNLYRQREEALFTQINQMLDADPPQDADFLIGQLELVRSQIAALVDNAPGNPCAGYGIGN